MGEEGEGATGHLFSILRKYKDVFTSFFEFQRQTNILNRQIQDALMADYGSVLSAEHSLSWTCNFTVFHCLF